MAESSGTLPGTEPKPRPSGPICRHFSAGYCKFGNNCRFRHPAPAQSHGGIDIGLPNRPAALPFLPEQNSRPAFTSVRGMETWLRSRAADPPAEKLSRLSSATGLALLFDAVHRTGLPERATRLLVELLSGTDLRTSMLREETNKVYGLLPGSPFLANLHVHVQSLAEVTAPQLQAYADLCEEVQARVEDGWMHVPLDVLSARARADVRDGPEKARLVASLDRLVEQRGRLRRRQAAPSEGLRVSLLSKPGSAQKFVCIRCL